MRIQKPWHDAGSTPSSMPTQGEQYSKNLNRTIIEGECRAYILDKADETGTELAEVTVTAEWSTDGYWYPHEVRIVSGADENQRGQSFPTAFRRSLA